MANFQDLRSDALLLVIDLQPKFLSAMWESERAAQATKLLARAAQRFGVPILLTEQNPARMGPTDAGLAAIASPGLPKMSFSAWQDAEIRSALERQPRRTIILAGIETHICVALTARDLIEAGYEVIVCPDAVTAGSVDRHKLGMELIRDSGALPAHSETVVYAWTQSAEDPGFRQVLDWVKQGRG